MKRFLSLGAGIQSSAVALQAAAGEIEQPDAAIFADTGWEPAAVYVWLDWLIGRLPFPVHVVSAGNIRDDLMRSEVQAEGVRWVSPPLFTVDATGSPGMVRRQCTREYKIDPITKEKRRLLGYEPRQRIPEGACETWIGISTDEASRMKPSTERWNVNRWPLIEKWMSRADCQVWLERYLPADAPPVPRSACIGCPFRSDREWLTLTPDEFEDACLVDDALRTNGAGYGRSQGIREDVYLHAARIPLREVKLGRNSGQLEMWGNECEGMCGL